jgi:hypothetical protein
VPCDSPFRKYSSGQQVYVKSKDDKGKYIKDENGHDVRELKVFTDDIDVDCGVCYPCRHRRLVEWCYRLQKEDARSRSSFFVTLTYSPEKVPLSPNGFMTLEKGSVLNLDKSVKVQKTSVQLFMKRLRKSHANYSDDKIKFWMVGEYGDISKRPHYHMLIFNLCDDKIIMKEWDQGSVYIGRVTGASIAYCCKYSMKEHKIPMFKNDDRVEEYSVCSKGIGDNFLTEEMIRWLKADLTRSQIVNSQGYKINLPRYYSKKVYNKRELMEKRIIILDELKKKEKLERIKVDRLYKGAVSYEQYKDAEKYGRELKQNSLIKKTLRDVKKKED